MAAKPERGVDKRIVTNKKKKVKLLVLTPLVLAEFIIAAGRSGLKSGFWTGHGWGNVGPEFRAGTGAGAGARVFLLL